MPGQHFHHPLAALQDDVPVLDLDDLALHGGLQHPRTPPAPALRQFLAQPHPLTFRHQDGLSDLRRSRLGPLQRLGHVQHMIFAQHFALQHHRHRAHLRPCRDQSTAVHCPRAAIAADG